MFVSKNSDTPNTQENGFLSKEKEAAQIILS